MSNSKNNNSTIVLESTKRIASLKKYVTSSKTEIPVGGEIARPADLIAIFQESLDTRAAVTATQAAYRSAVLARIEAEGKRAVADGALKAWVLNRFGAGSTEAHEFGYAARKAPVVSAEGRATAVLQNRATREARGTMGKKEKLKIRGTVVVPGVPAVPVSTAAPAASTGVAAAAPAPAAAPAVRPVANGAAPVASA